MSRDGGKNRSGGRRGRGDCAQGSRTQINPYLPESSVHRLTEVAHLLDVAHVGGQSEDVVEAVLTGHVQHLAFGLLELLAVLLVNEDNLEAKAERIERIYERSAPMRRIGEEIRT